MTNAIHEAAKELQAAAASCHRIHRDFLDKERNYYNPTCAVMYQDDAARQSSIARRLMGLE